MHTYTVSGGGRFPLSMLRFDNSWPFTDEDAGKIDNSFDSFGRWEVTLQTTNPAAPCLGRWDSFNCRVLEGAE
jgi:hypothetical protein